MSDVPFFFFINSKRILTFAAITPGQRCGGDLVATVTGGTILSPEFASDEYYNADVCEWRITTSQADQQVFYVVSAIILDLF